MINTFYALLDQDEQTRCFKNVARHLTSDGVFVIEAFIPDMNRFDDRQIVRVTDMDEQGVRLEISQLEMVKQQIRGQTVLLTSEGVRFFPVKIRYAWPSELDLMASLAGLKLLHRWSSWDRGALTEDSEKHISVYSLNA